MLVVGSNHEVEREIKRGKRPETNVEWTKLEKWGQKLVKGKAGVTVEAVITRTMTGVMMTEGRLEQRRVRDVVVAAGERMLGEKQRMTEA